jgi:hypothetical protein
LKKGSDVKRSKNAVVFIVGLVLFVQTSFCGNGKTAATLADEPEPVAGVPLAPLPPLPPGQMKKSVFIRSKKAGAALYAPLAQSDRRYKRVIMLVDDGGESSAGALTVSFMHAAHEQAAPIIVSKNIVYNYLNIARDNERGLKDYLGELPVASLHEYAVLLESFDLQEWDIYERGFFYLFIPKKYLQKERERLFERGMELHKNEVYSSSRLPSEVILGFNLNPMEGSKKVALQGARPEEMRNALKDSIYQQYQNTENFELVLSDKVAFYWYTHPLLDEIQSFFLASAARTWNRETREFQEVNDHSFWVLFLEGHGTNNLNSVNQAEALKGVKKAAEVAPPQIAGFAFRDFAALIRFFSTKEKTAFLYYSTCFGGGYSLHFLQSIFEAYFNRAQNKVVQVTKPNFVIAIGTLTDTASYAIWPKLTPDRRHILEPTINFSEFFESSARYFGGSLQERGSLSSIFRHTYQKPHNIPNVWIPGTGFTKAISHTAEIMPITKVMIRAKVLESGHARAYGHFAQEPFIDIEGRADASGKFVKQIGLLYAQHIPLTIRLGLGGSLLSMNEDRVHFIDAIELDAESTFRVFCGDLEAKTESDKEFEHTLFFIKKWSIKTSASSQAKTPLSSFQQGDVMIVLVKGPGVADCLYKRGSKYYRVHGSSLNSKCANLKLFSGSISYDDFKRSVVNFIRDHKLASFAGKMFDYQLLGKYIPDMKNYFYEKELEPMLTRIFKQYPLKSQDLNNKKVGTFVPHAEVEGATPLVEVELDDLRGILSRSRLVMAKDEQGRYVYALLQSVDMLAGLTLYCYAAEGDGFFMFTLKDLQEDPSRLLVP